PRDRSADYFSSDYPLPPPPGHVAERCLAPLFVSPPPPCPVARLVGAHRPAAPPVLGRVRVCGAEGDGDAAVLEHDRERALVEVARVSVRLLVAERAAQHAQRGRVTADLDRCGPRSN